MDILFENRFSRTREVAKDMYSHHFFKSKSAIFAYVFFSLCLILQLVLGLYTHKFGYLIITAAIVFFVFAFRIFCYFNSVKLMSKRDMECFGKEAEIVVFVKEECIEYGTVGAVPNKLLYSNIKFAYETKNLILIRSTARLLYIVKKDSFIKGSAKEFEEFLRSKGIKVR